jgi:hypothetical protein
VTAIESTAVVDRVDGKEQAARTPERRLALIVDVLHQLANRHTNAQARDSKVVAPQPEQRKSDEGGKGRGHDGRERQREEERPLRLGDQHAGRVGADAEEGHIAEGCVPGDPSDDVPGRRHHDEHRDDGRDSEP